MQVMFVMQAVNDILPSNTFHMMLFSERKSPIESSQAGGGGALSM